MSTELKFDLEYYEFLDDLRGSGVTNMWGSPAYVQREFGGSRREAFDIVKDWMHTFSERSGLERRKVGEDE